MNKADAKKGVSQTQMVDFMKKHAAEMRKRFNSQPPKILEERMERTMKKMMALQEKMNE